MRIQDSGFRIQPGSSHHLPFSALLGVLRVLCGERLRFFSVNSVSSVAKELWG